MSEQILVKSEAASAGRLTFVGLFLVTLATLGYELLLTRIFSVTMWYHFAFMAVSVAVFGMTVGAIAVYLTPTLFTRDSTNRMLGINTILFSVTCVLSLWLHFLMLEQKSLDMSSIMQITYLVIAVPFFFSGVSVCLVLTRFAKQVTQLYAIDLLGAAAGCLFLPAVLELVDGPTAVLVVASLAGLAACAFSADIPKLRAATIAISVIFIASIPINQSQHFLKLGSMIKGRQEEQSLYEKWSMSARIRVFGDGNTPQPAAKTGWALSDTVPVGLKVRQLNLDIDSFAGTFLTAFDGDLQKCAISNMTLRTLFTIFETMARSLSLELEADEMFCLDWFLGRKRFAVLS